MSASPIILVNGSESRVLDTTDRGVAYGDGVFETIQLLSGRLLYLDLHLARMKQGLDRLHIPAERVMAKVQRDISSLEPQFGDTKKVLKIIVTRGAGGRGYAVSEQLKPTRVVQLSVAPEFPSELYRQGIKSRICQYQLSDNPVLAGIKHLNRLDQVMARSEWSDPDIREGIVCDRSGNVVEGTMSNLFWVEKGELYTPDLSNYGVSGIVRNQLIALAKANGIKVNIGIYPLDCLLRADEVFFSNSLINVWPVQAIDEQVFTIGNVTRLLQAALEEDYLKC